MAIVSKLSRQILAWSVALALSAAAVASDELDRDRNWHQWRGPRATGFAPHADPPVKWDPKTNIRWKVDIPGDSSATPIVWGDRVYLVSAVETDRVTDTPSKPAADAKTRPPTNYHQFVVYCLARDSGEVVWKTVATDQVPHEGRHPTHSYAAASPMTDGERLYVSFGSRGVFCLDLEGNKLWERDLGDMRTRYGWGEAISPVVHGDSVIINWDHEDDSAIYSLDATTGETRWQQPRDEPTSWATPLVVRVPKKDQNHRDIVVVNGTNYVRAYDLRTGELAWRCSGQTLNAIPTPVHDGEFAYVMSGYRGAMAQAIPLSGRGELADASQLAWTHTRGTPYVPSPLLYEDRLYFTRRNSAVLSCLQARTGTSVINEQRLPDLRNLYSSPVGAAGRIYIVDRDGTTLVIQASDSLQILATNRLDDPIDASPVLVGKQVFLRSRSALYCIEDG